MNELLNTRLLEWVVTHLASENVDVIPSPFWVIPIDMNDPVFKELVSDGLDRLKSTKITGEILHESLIFIALSDRDGKKICVASSESSLSKLNLSIENKDFIESDLGFLQFAHLVTKYKLPSVNKIPILSVNVSPVFEDDILPYFPRIHTLKLSELAEVDRIEIITLKILLEIENETVYVKKFRDLILSVGYSIPIEDHGWIFEQLFSAIRSQRLVNFYLGIYKLFEFFFPLDNIFSLADKLEFNNSELVLLEYCRGALSWNVNHQRGSRAAASYAPVGFAEMCLNETFTGQDDQIPSFKAKAIDKLTNSRHALTHQDFKSSDIKENDLLTLTSGLLTFLRDAFTQYGTRIADRRKIVQDKKQKE
ncbi:hypothetical protein SOM61_04460 [Massilia sp. CFBP9012]|uniref:hypothetical protein n=1 Tax=Massilia sp. CFBP9012 TaxID=3096531 RepID=UPI002A6A2119|nr:hypothetical protein [Massilia sp. CFBP9012]MDY0974207.1 hypothetical protein [Massilia sp. CFBP9012]